MEINIINIKIIKMIFRIEKVKFKIEEIKPKIETFNGFNNDEPLIIIIELKREGE